MHLQLQRLEVGPWPMNCYLLRCPRTQVVAVVDPGADADAILAAVNEAPVLCILLTHGHADHVGAVEAICQATDAPVGIHPADAAVFDLEADFPLIDGMEVEIGKGRVVLSHAPGHTAGSICLRLGHTTTPDALAQSLVSLGRTVFTWPDQTELFPGHGPSTTVGSERSYFERFIQADHPLDLCGDVSWR